MVFLTSSFGALDGKARALGTTRSVPLSPSSREGSSTHSLIGQDPDVKPTCAEFKNQ